MRTPSNFGLFISQKRSHDRHAYCPPRHRFSADKVHRRLSFRIGKSRSCCGMAVTAVTAGLACLPYIYLTVERRCQRPPLSKTRPRNARNFAVQRRVILTGVEIFSVLPTKPHYGHRDGSRVVPIYKSTMPDLIPSNNCSVSL